ncbi:MAG: hypothetical protein ACYCZN_12195 [Candidatus Dormibacteria bacterium]
MVGEGAVALWELPQRAPFRSAACAPTVRSGPAVARALTLCNPISGARPPRRAGSAGEGWHHLG